MVEKNIFLQNQFFFPVYPFLRTHKCGIIFTRFRTFIRWKKAAMLNIFFTILLVRDIGADYISQSRSEFDWYYPHLYNYCHGLKTIILQEGEITFSVELKNCFENYKLFQSSPLLNLFPMMATLRNRRQLAAMSS